MNSAYKRGAYLILLLIIALLAVVLRLRAVEQLPIDFDEDDYLLAGQHYAQAIRDRDWVEIVNYEYNYEHPSLVKLTYGLVLTRLPQIPEIAQKPTSAPPADTLPQPHLDYLRRASALLGALEVLALAFLDPLAGIFLAIHTFTIKYTSQAMLEAMPALTSLLAVMAYDRSRKSQRTSSWLVLSGIALGLTAASKYIYAVVGIVILLHWLWATLTERQSSQQKQDGWRPWLPILSWGILALFIFILADVYLWPDPIGRLKASLAFNAAYSQSDEVQSMSFPFWQPLATIFQSVPWHPGVFVIALDTLIALLGLLGFRRLWRGRQVYAFWLVVGLVFLLIWPTKWQQYILIISAPVSLAAAEGFRGVVWIPISGWMIKILSRSRDISAGEGASRVNEGLRAIPWLLPGLVILAAIALFPLVFQLAISLTDFKATAIRDGLTGGVWREVWLGLSGQIEPVVVDELGQSFSSIREVSYVGLSLLKQLFSGLGVSVLVFEVIWTFLSVGMQLTLGLGVALVLHRRGIRFKRFWLAIFILPWAIPEFIGVLIWQRMFEPRFGWMVLALNYPEIANYPFGPQLASWQENPDMALLVLLIAATWYGFPLMMVSATAALKLLPQEVHDAADIDGAGRWSKFRWVTWPMILPLLVPAIIIRSIFAFNQFYLFYVLQTPFPLVTLATLSFFVFDVGGPFGGYFALSAAINVMTVVLLVLFIYLFNRWSKAAEGVTYA
jgi:ABC-type sugar transport system permease subunit